MEIIPFPDNRIGTDHDTAMQLRTGPQLGFGLDDTVGSNDHVVAKNSILVYYRTGMDFRHRFNSQFRENRFSSWMLSHTQPCVAIPSHRQPT